MPKFTNVNTLPFSSEELEFFEGQMRQYKVPWLYKIVFGSLYKWGKYFMPLIFLAILVMAIIHATTRLDLFNVIKGFALFWIFGIGIPVLIAFVWHRLKVLKECKRLGLTLYQWNLLAIAFQIKYI